jgi:HAD superfamily hydrolase (TIGR01484 family)
MRLRMVVTDLDGTLLDPEQRLSAVDRSTLEALGRAGSVRVVATGRSLFSAQKVLGPDLPIDFLVHTSGAGIVTWPARDALRTEHMEAALAVELVRVLTSRGCDFMLHRAITHNHEFLVHRTARHNADFDRRLTRYASHARELRLPFHATETMCQAVIIESSPAAGRQAELEAALPAFRVIRATSPLDGSSTWFEIFPKGVGKAAAAAWLLREIDVLRPCGAAERGVCVAVGNDYNDVDLLDWADFAFVVGNAPEELRSRYSSVGSNSESGFSDAVRRMFVEARIDSAIPMRG